VRERISSITADGECAFLSNQILMKLHDRNIETHFKKADYLNHIKMIDNVLKTLRNMFNGDISRMNNNNEIQKTIQYLNTIINRSSQITPPEMRKDPYLEEIWIRSGRNYNNITI
jgi:hypothetical protein